MELAISLSLSEGHQRAFNPTLCSPRTDRLRPRWGVVDYCLNVSGGARHVTTDGFEAIARFIETELGFATSHYNDRYLDRRFAARMRRAGADSYEEYLKQLRTDPDEQTAILDALSVNVTRFFRNTEVWTGIKAVLYELEQEPDDTTVWSAACADGREPYSVGLLAADTRSIDETAVSVLGTDINEQALKTAQQGVYQSSRTADLNEQLSFLSGYHQYVEERDETITIGDSVRDRVSFRRHDIINDPPLREFDLVLCRNLFIYIDNEYKQPIIETIVRSLAPGGYLVIGKAETLPPSVRSSFATVDRGLRIYRLID